MSKPKCLSFLNFFEPPLAKHLPTCGVTVLECVQCGAGGLTVGEVEEHKDRHAEERVRVGYSFIVCLILLFTPCSIVYH